MTCSVFRESCRASQLALLCFLIPLNALCAASEPSHDVHAAVSPTFIRGEEHGVLPSAQPFLTQPTTNLPSPNTIPPTPPPYTFRLLELHAILAPPEMEQYIATAMERLCEAFAYALLDLDLLADQHLVLRLGGFTLDFYDVAEQLSVLAMKAVVVKLMQMIGKGLFGFIRGEMISVRAGVRLLFAFGVLDDDYEDWGFRKRETGDNSFKKSKVFDQGTRSLNAFRE